MILIRVRLIHHQNFYINSLLSPVRAIVETASDAFAVIVGNASNTTGLGVPGSFLIWFVDSNTPDPTARLFTGLLTLDASLDLLLVGDSTPGIVWRVNNNRATTALPFTNLFSQALLVGGPTAYVRLDECCISPIQLNGLTVASLLTMTAVQLETWRYFRKIL